MTSRVQITDENEDRLFRVFDAAQAAERRIFRMLARGFYNANAVDELRRQIASALEEVDELAAEAKIV